MSVVRNALLWASQNDTLRARVPQWGFVRRALRQFMPGERLEDALEAAATLAEAEVPATFTKLGENLTRVEEIESVVADYYAAYDAIAARDLDVEVSVKLTQLGLDLDEDHTSEAVLQLAKAAADRGNWLWIDMEASEYVDRTLAIFRRAKQDFEHVGVCLQAYLHRTAADIEALAPLRPGIRLVKGAYKEPSSVALTKRSDIDAAFVRLSRDLMERPGVRVALASHDVRLLNGLELNQEAEIHMLYGIRAADLQRYADRGHPVRTLISYGPEWYPWYVRRLAERPANLGFVVRNLFARS